MAADELLEIYDEYNVPLGQAKRRDEVHRHGYWHRVVHIYVVNQHGELLVHLRSPHKDTWPNCWDTRFGGHVPSGWSEADTAEKEVAEEINIHVTRGDLEQIPEVIRYDGGTNREHQYPFVLRRDLDVANLHFNDGEVVEVRWMKPDEIVAAIRRAPASWLSNVQSFQHIIGFINDVDRR